MEAKRFVLPASLIAAGLTLCGLAAEKPRAAATKPARLRFRKIVVDKAFRSEGVAVGDVNRDGRADLLVGDVWYEAPDWKVHEVRKVGKYNPARGYSNCFANFAWDVNGDGWIDSIVVGYPGAPCHWYENPRNAPGHWKQGTVARSACNETPLFADLLGDGKRVAVFGCEGKMAWFGIPKDVRKPWDMHAVAAPKAPGTHKYAHGLGVGDVNGDGRKDILVTAGWWEAPEDRTKPNWKFHKASLGPDCADMIVYDVDGDGDSDVVTSSAHRYGMWWFEQTRTEKGIQFKRHEISKAFSQAHALILADINADGLKDLVTGKRYFAHNGGDPGAKQPAVLYWLQLRRTAKGKVQFIPHKIDDDSGVGTQFVVTDLNGDKRLDIATSNKKGVHLFIQEREAGK